jgi:hypothetical protein
VSIEILVEPYYLAKIALDMAITLACAFMIIVPALRIWWLKKHKDTSAEDS